LEWLTYKDENASILDDLFTGQLVEAQHCTACNRISVNIQTFNILPVPIVGPRQISGIVHLDDCFAKFGTIEELYGPEGLQCEGCNRAFMEQPAATPVRRPGMGNGIVSPIANSSNIISDNSFSDSLFKTSTPIHGAPVPRGIKVTDGQRRSLLRQLPECLIVQLLRFSFHQGQPRKVYRPVSIPLNTLDLTSLIIDNVMKREDLTALHTCFRYNLYGLVLHLGGESTGFGHYVAYTQASNNVWYKFDDHNVTEVNMEYELNTKTVRENAYLLFYKKSVTTP
jgi:ubiquitin carboxyl-terminal hydrolase 8